MRVLHFLDIRDADLLAHLFDLADAQIEAGHEVGLICSDYSAGSLVEERLAALGKRLTLGLLRVPMSRGFRFEDFSATRTALAYAKQQQPHLIHSHGLKGGAIGRIVGRFMKRRPRPVIIYSPHGIGPEESSSKWLLRLEKRLLQSTDGLIFESHFAAARYEEMFGPFKCPAAIIPYGIREDEFVERQIIDNAFDFLYIGELRRSNGVDTLIKAIARMKTSRPTGALIVGKGPEETELRRQVDRYGLAHRIFFNTPMNRPLAFLKGSCLVVPSRDDAFPRIVLEGAAVGMPMILTNVGGTAEIVGNIPMPLIPPGDTGALVEQLTAFLDNPHPYFERALDLKERVAANYTAQRMTSATEAFYHDLVPSNIY